MFFKIDNELFNYSNLKYFEYYNEILEIYFNGNVASKIKQSEEEFLEFIKIIKENKDIILLNNYYIGCNLKNISGFSEKENTILIYFVDGLFKKFDNLSFEQIEKQILGE